MKYVLITIFLFCFVEVFSQSMGTLEGFPDAVVTDSKQTDQTITDYTCGVFTYNPRISADGNYYEVDIYIARNGVTSTQRAWMVASYAWCNESKSGSGLGGFSAVFDRVGGQTKVFRDVYDFADMQFIPNAILLGNGVSTCQSPVKLSGKGVNSGASIAVGYVKQDPGLNEETWESIEPYRIYVEPGKPIKMGTFRFKIKDKTANSMLKIATGSAAVPYGTVTQQSAATKYIAVGWLDGKDPNIPLAGEPAGPEAPDAPTINVPATKELCLTKNNGAVNYTYSITEANKKDSVVWIITAPNSTTPVSNTVATWTPASKSQNTTVTWKKAGTYWVNAYVHSNYLANSGHSDVADSEYSHVEITVKDRPQAALTFNKSSYRPSDGQIVATVRDNSTLTGTKNYGWIKPRVVSASTTGTSLTQSSIAAGASYDFQAYVRAANGCSDTTAVETKVVGDNPKLTVEVEEVYALCANGVGELRVKRVTTEAGAEVALASCTFAWKKDGGSTNVSTTANCPVTAAGTYSVTVTGGGAQGTVSQTVTQSSNSAPVLADRDFYVKTTSARPVIWTQAGNGMSAEDLSWNWSPENKLDDATRERPTVTSLASGTNTFDVYAVHEATKCRSTNANVRVLVSSSNGMDVTIDPGEAVTLCRNNHRYLTAKVNGQLGTTLTGYTYEWMPDTYLSATSGAQVVFNATDAGTYEVFVTATRGAYSSTQKITVTVKDDEAPEIRKESMDGWLACTGSSIGVNVVPPLENTGQHYTYAWTNNGNPIGSNSSSFTFATDGEYDMSLKVTAPNGCEADTVMWQHMSVRTAPEDLELSLSGQFGTGGTVMCGGSGTLTLTYKGTTKPEIIRWYRNGTEVTAASGKTTWAVTAADAGSTYKVTASNGVCEASTADFSFTVTTLPASLAIDVVESCGEIVLSSTPSEGFNGWEWSANGLTPVGGTTSSTVRFSGSSFSTYTVNLKAKNGAQCYMTATKSVDLKQKPNLAWADNNPTNECEGDVLRVTSDMTMRPYVWKNGNVTAASTSNAYTLPLNGGNITAIGTAENGCMDTLIGSFAGHSKPDLAWQSGKEPASKYYAGEKIEAAVRATKGDGSYHYVYESPERYDAGSDGTFKEYVAAINGTNDFFVTVADGHGCRDTLQKAIAVEGQSLIVTIESKHDVFACANGSAILTAKVQHGVGELLYQWYRNGAAIAGATDSVYIVNFPSSGVTSEVYRVEVNCPMTTGTGDATKQWTASPGSAPQLTVLADVITILPAEVAVLGAEAFSPVSNTFNWHWTNEEKLAAGEETKQYPHTVPLKGKTQYQVYVIDDRKCMSNIGDVEVRVDPMNGLQVAVVPENAVLCRNNSVELTATANKTIDACEWYSSALPNDGITLEKNRAQAIFKAGDGAVAKDYQQVVKVTSGGYSALALNAVTVKSDRAPKLPVPKDGCGGLPLYILDVENVPDDGYVWFVNGALLDDENSFMHQFDNNDYAVKVVMKASDNTCWSDTLRLNVWQMPEITGDMIADKTTVTKNDKAKLEVPLSDVTLAYTDMQGSWSTSPVGFAGSASGTHNRLMTTSALTENNTTVTYTISNTHDAECKASKSLNLTVFDPATGFDISLDKQVFADCEGKPVQVKITPINADGVAVNYELTGTKDGEALEALKISRPGVIGEWATDIRDLEAGEYQLFIAATETKNSSIARDTVSFTVHPNPTISVGSLASTDLCVGNGDSLRVVLTFANGTPWKLDYRDGGISQPTITGITSTDYSLYLKKSGNFSITKVENAFGCTASQLPGVENIRDLTPKVEVDEEGFVSFCQGGDKAVVAMEFAGGTPDWKIYYKLDGGAQQSATANQASYGLELTEGGLLKVDSVVNSEGCRATITSGALFDGVPVEDDRLQVEFLTPDPESICASGGVGATIALHITPEPTAWPLQVNCLIHLTDGSDRQLNCEIRATDKDKDGNYLLKDITYQGEYVLTSIVDGNRCQGAIGANDTKVMNVGTLPEVNIDSTDFVALKGQEFVLNALDKKDNFTYSWSLNDATEEADNGGVRGRMEDEDMVYRLIARDAGGCVAEDTVTVYRVPDAPQVNITKADGDNKLKIHWEHNGRKTNGFKLWHNEWDAYAIESAYTETGDSFAATATPEAILDITDQDTLEFFYVVAFREIDLKDGQGKRRFSSLPSDTVGYHQQFLIYDDTIGGNNMVSYGFDMSEVMGGNMASQFVAVVIGGGDRIFGCSDFIFQDQNWFTCSSLDGWITGDDDYEIQVGRSYMIEVDSTRSFLSYGKLPAKMSYIFRMGEKGSITSVCLPLHHCNLHSTGDVMRALGVEKVSINYWNFKKQNFMTTFWNGGDEYDIDSSIPLRSLDPIFIDPLLEDVDDVINWE